MKSTIKALAELILQNVDVLDASISNAGGKDPSLDEPFNPETDYPYHNPDVVRASDIISAAAMQLLQTVRAPQMCLISEAVMHAIPAAMLTASELHIPELLREAGPKGLHVKEIAKLCSVDASKLSSILRVLASRLIFKEVRPDVFANNKLSSVLDKGSTFKELQRPSTPKYDDPKSALTACINHLADEGAKCSAYLHESVTDPEFAMSGDPGRCALSKAFNYNKALWDFYEEPTQKDRLYRFGVGMEGVKRFEPPDLAVNGDGFTWESLSENALVVDVGGGIGSVSIQVAEMYPKLKFIVQDRAPVIADGIKRCEHLKKDLLTSGQVTFQEHDFFSPQPIKDATVFLMKHILHDWSDEYSKKILRQLREAAGPHTKLFVLEKVPPYTCPISSEDKSITVPGFTPYEVPPPLSIVGGGDTFPYIIGLMMMQFNNGQERTIGHYVSLFRDSGWKIEKVVQPDPLGRRPTQIRAVPM